MVKKLLKHEFIYYLRTFGMFLPIVLVVGIITRVFSFLDSINNNENLNIITNMALSSSSLILFVSCMAILILASIISIVRFYKNMYSSEGYLTFTLPVTNAQHIFVKLFSSVVFQAICVAFVIAAVSIAFPSQSSGNVDYNDPSYLMAKEFIETCGIANIIGWIIEFVVLIIISPVYSTLLNYACITIGQTAKKNRILMAVVTYFIYYVITQCIGTVFSMIVTVLGITGALDGLGIWLENNFVVAIHIFLCTAIVGMAAISAIFWIITQTIMTKKLNLE